MNPTLKELLRLCKDIEIEHLTASGIVCEVGLWLFDVHYCTNSGGVSASTIYRGTSAADRILLNLTGLQSTSFNYDFSMPCYCPNGLYISIGSNVAGVTFQFLRDLR